MMVLKWITERSCLVVKTTVITASLFLFKHQRIFSNLYFDENTKLKTIKSASLKINDEPPPYTEDNLSPQISRLCQPLNLFYPAFDEVFENSHAGLRIAHYKF